MSRAAIYLRVSTDEQRESTAAKAAHAASQGTRNADVAAVRELAAAEEYAAEHDVNDADFGNCTFAEFSGGLDRLKTARSALDALTREPARG